MSLRCVVGNCEQPDEKVERYYWSADDDTFAPIEDHAYLDLCWFHSMNFTSQTIQTFKPGWDRKKS